MDKQYKITLESKGLHVYFWGQTKVQTVLDAHAAYYQHPRLRELAYGIWDFSQADPSAFEKESLYRIIASDLTTSSALQSHWMAVIGTDPQTRELLETYIEGFRACHQRWKIRLFSTELEARTWLGDELDIEPNDDHST